jgi:hypothetical protein
VSEAINDGGSAFPNDVAMKTMERGGMTLRDYFAAKALQGFCAYGALSNPDHGHTVDDVVEDAYTAADAMLRARVQA